MILPAEDLDPWIEGYLLLRQAILDADRGQLPAPPVPARWDFLLLLS
ncbi:MAG: hypothetical protein ACRDSG_09420 [Pseudonocardiaceae bacterium]